MKRDKTFSSGFSLVEILVAAAILGAILTGLMTVLSYSIKSNNQAKIRTVARDRAQEAIDFVRAQKEALGYGGLKQVLSGLDGNGDDLVVLCLGGDDTNANSTSVNDHIFSDLSSSCSLDDDIDTNTGTSVVRTITFDLSDVDQIDLEARVVWENDNGDEVQVTANTLLRSW